MIELDEQSNKAIYEQIIDEIKRNIMEGKLKPKDQIPSIRELANTLGVNPNTVKKSYRVLESEEIIKSRSTKGTYITSKIDDIIEEMKDLCYNKIEMEIAKLEKLGISRKEIVERISR